MAAFKSGKYVIRFEPHGVGGMYATRQELPDLPVTLGAQVPDLVARQSWVAKTGDTENHWFITSFDETVGTIKFLSTEDPTAVPSGPVIVVFAPVIPDIAYEKFQQWIVTPVDVPEVANTYTIQPVTKAVGMSYYVGVKDNELHIQAFDIRDDSPKPYWQFIAESTD